jgi:hypothetical protein
LYGANVGWINLGDGEPANGVAYGNQSAADFGVNRDATGGLTGLAWGANIGWLVFTNRSAGGAAFDAPRLDLFTGRFSGYAFAPNIGWVTLSNLFAHVKTDIIESGADTDADGVPDSWELSLVGDLNLITSNSNLDGDQATDREEYLADTHPLVSGDELRVTVYIPPTQVAPGFITWTTRPTRIYRLEDRSGFNPGDDPWMDAGWEWFAPDAGTTTTRVLTKPPMAQGYLRVGARPPLAP